MTKYFTLDEFNEFCYPEYYFRDLMEFEGYDDMEVYVAKKVDKKETEGFFWCSKYNTTGETEEGMCGNGCKHYAPRNRKSGCCRYYSKTLYKRTNEKVIFKNNREQMP